MGDTASLSISGVLVALVVVVALIVKGGDAGLDVPPRMTTTHRTGAIVIEKQRLEFPAGARSTEVNSVETMLTETSRSGSLVATYSSVGGQQQVNVGTGDVEQIYDPHDNTIYVTTFRAILAAQQRLLEASLPQGSVSSHDTVVMFGSSTTPGWTSEYLQDLWDHSYRLAGRATVDGRPALELVPTPAYRRDGSGSGDSGGEVWFPTVYVSPKTYDPIRLVTHSPAQNGFHGQTFVTDWLEYRVIPATPANQRLLSLTALHPTAKISHSAMAYARATARPLFRGGSTLTKAAAGTLAKQISKKFSAKHR